MYIHILFHILIGIYDYSCTIFFCTSMNSFVVKFVKDQENIVNVQSCTIVETLKTPPKYHYGVLNFLLKIGEVKLLSMTVHT